MIPLGGLSNSADEAIDVVLLPPAQSKAAEVDAAGSSGKRKSLEPADDFSGGIAGRAVGVP